MQKVFISKNKSLGTTQMTINSKVVEYFWYHGGSLGERVWDFILVVFNILFAYPLKGFK